MRLATYNVEWFTALFDDDGGLLADGTWSSRYNVTRLQQLEALAKVFTALDADGILIVEAPDENRRRSTVAALENFAQWAGLRARRAVIGFGNNTQQEIAFLYDPDQISAWHDPMGETGSGTEGVAPRFDKSLLIDLDTDAAPEDVVFSKPPLELALKTASGFELRMIGIHVKSKAPHGARNAADEVRISIENRRKQLAQCIWVRRRVVEHLNAGDALIVLGDFNDGPGLDEYEKLFGRSSVEIVLGETQGPQLYDPHARLELSHRFAATPTTARFYIHPQKRYLQALLDYIMLSPDLMSRAPDWRIWHPFEDARCYELVDLREALLTASDHFPVTLDIDI
ncbi:endonuclease/exonuclease/phosphatase family protein [Candidatus Halocynthiibacter alkanivorans]|uniref:endonuclease/exonuclease/phosphatase family protein n=1 Tax=Candidatus Halocynthiibacter alkanivorans TaxID=2267619 RepID=UPI000DF44236|nr:endonuclease/exonuclease/phosphatase family protein [Candidatus Halocynthiibacter alkanivorans]